MAKVMSAPGTTGADRRAARAARRAASIKLLESDLSLAEVAVRVGVSREAIRQWREKWHAGGAAKLVAPAAGVGRPQRLSPVQQRELIAHLKLPATAFGFASVLWTTRRVATVIEREFRFTYTVPGLFRMLERFGFRHTRKGGWRPYVAADASRSGRREELPWGFARNDAGRIVVARMERHATEAAREMQESGRSVAEIVGVLRGMGVVARSGRAITRRGVERLLRSGKGYAVK